MSKFSAWKERLAQQASKAKRKPQPTEPTYPATNTMPIEEARQALDRHLDEFIEAALNPNWAEHFATEDAPLVEAVRAATGIGKTQRFAALLAQHRHQLRGCRCCTRCRRTGLVTTSQRNTRSTSRRAA
jgi:hypothetical protein